MNRLLALALALTLTSCAAREIGPIDVATLPIRSNRPDTADPSSCVNKPKCIVLYSAPWCRKTKQSHDFINALQMRLETDPNYGLMFIIGNDDPAEIFAYGKSFPGLHYFDPGDTAAEKLAIDIIPDVLVFDRQGKLLYRDSGVPRKSDDRTIREFIASLQED